MSIALTLRGDYEGGLAEARRALAISPNVALGHAALGVALLHSGRPREAIHALRQGLRHDPYDPRRFIRLTQIGVGHYFLRECDAAVEVMKETIRPYSDHPLAYSWLAASLGQLGRADEGREALQKAIAIAPKLFDTHARQHIPWRRPEDYEHMLDGLRKAGWEG